MSESGQQMLAGERLPGADRAPDWLEPLVQAATSRPLPGWLGRHPVTTTGRRSAVLIALADGPSGPDLLLLRRAGTLRNHAGQPAFPGGRQEPGESDIDTALREAQEETGLDPAGVLPVALLRELSLEFSGHLVRPVLAHWRDPSPVRAVDAAETASVHRIPLAQLADPAHRGRVRLSSGFSGPAFSVAGMIVWGFTGLLVDAILELGGWSVSWGPGPDLALPADDAGRALRSSGIEPPVAEPAGVEPAGAEPPVAEPAAVEPAGVEPAAAAPPELPLRTDDPRVDDRTHDQVPQ